MPVLQGAIYVFWKCSVIPAMLVYPLDFKWIRLMAGICYTVIQVAELLSEKAMLEVALSKQNMTDLAIMK